MVAIKIVANLHPKDNTGVFICVIAITNYKISSCGIVRVIIARPVTVPEKAKFTVCSIIKLATIAFDETSSYLSARLLPEKAKFTVCTIIKLATLAFDETSSYWSAPKSS